MGFLVRRVMGSNQSLKVISIDEDEVVKGRFHWIGLCSQRVKPSTWAVCDQKKFSKERGLPQIPALKPIENCGWNWKHHKWRFALLKVFFPLEDPANVFTLKWTNSSKLTLRQPKHVRLFVNRSRTYIQIEWKHFDFSQLQSKSWRSHHIFYLPWTNGPKTLSRERRLAVGGAREFFHSQVCLSTPLKQSEIITFYFHVEHLR